jgi:hypothetical protein
VAATNDRGGILERLTTEDAMSWSTVGKVCAGLIALSIAGNFIQRISAETKNDDAGKQAAYDVRVEAEIAAINARAPFKSQAFDGTPQTILGVILENKVLTYSIAFSDTDLEGTEDDRKVARVGLVAHLCATPSLRFMLSNKYVVAYRMYNTKNKLVWAVPPIRLSDCPSA